MPEEGTTTDRILTDDVVNEAVRTLYEQHGYIKPDGEIDSQARIHAVFQIVNTAIVTSPKERISKAITRADLISQVFPSLAGPENWADQSDPELAEKAYVKIRSAVWGDVKPDRTGKVQMMVGQANGHPAMVLCQTFIGNDRIPAVYITRDLQCIIKDNSSRLKADTKKMAEKHAANSAMWMERMPDQAEKFDADYKSGMKAALQAGQSIVTLALEETVETRETDTEE